MRGLLDRWRAGRVKTTAQAPNEALLNPATQVSLQALISLQRYARKLDLTHRQSARAQLAGGHPSRFRGRGMDYQESRVYQPGDDIRHMDWRVTARAGRPHTKLFQEERERPIVVCLDLGPSQFFATQGALKSVIAAQAAALLGWAAAAQGDRIGALLFNSGHHELKPRSGHHGALQLIHALVKHADPVKGMAAAPHPGGLNEALIRLRRIVRPGSLVFLISDFYGLDDETANHLLRLRHHNDLLAIQTVDPLELTPPPAGRYGVTDGQTSGILDTRTGKSRQHYEDYFQQHQQTLKNLMQQRTIPLLQLSTTDNVARFMQTQFNNRATQPASKRTAA